MTDRELLELAAKAAGKLFNPTVRNRHGLLVVKDGADCQSEQELWNPLTCDGDALRLAVKLGIDIEFFTARIRAGEYPFDGVIELFSGNDYDEYASTRRAIVRAAAEVGKML